MTAATLAPDHVCRSRSIADERGSNFARFTETCVDCDRQIVSIYCYADPVCEENALTEDLPVWTGIPEADQPSECPVCGVDFGA